MIARYRRFLILFAAACFLFVPLSADEGHKHDPPKDKKDEAARVPS